MKLLYLWVSDYKIFQNKEFNFSAQYNIHYDHTNFMLKINENREFSDNFYVTNPDSDYNVELISYIIGDNGAGKTTLLNLLMTILPYDSGIPCEYKKFKVIYMLEHSNFIYIYTTLDTLTFKSQINRKMHIELITMQLNNRNYYSPRIMSDASIIFHSNIFDRMKYHTQSNFPGIIDISFNGLLREDWISKDIKWKSDLKSYLDADILRQIHFVAHNNRNKDLTKWIPFSLPKTLNLFF